VTVTIDVDALDATVKGMEGIMHPDDMPTVLAAILALAAEAPSPAVAARIREYRELVPGPDHEYD
jgi:hypothetical protein